MGGKENMSVHRRWRYWAMNSARRNLGICKPRELIEGLVRATVWGKVNKSSSHWLFSPFPLNSTVAVRLAYPSSSESLCSRGTRRREHSFGLISCSTAPTCQMSVISHTKILLIFSLVYIINAHQRISLFSSRVHSRAVNDNCILKYLF